MDDRKGIWDEAGDVSSNKVIMMDMLLMCHKKPLFLSSISYTFYSLSLYSILKTFLYTYLYLYNVPFFIHMQLLAYCYRSTLPIFAQNKKFKKNLWHLLSFSCFNVYGWASKNFPLPSFDISTYMCCKLIV